VSGDVDAVVVAAFAEDAALLRIAIRPLFAVVAAQTPLYEFEPE
jgi:hypothetical protein